MSRSLWNITSELHGPKVRPSSPGRIPTVTGNHISSQICEAISVICEATSVICEVMSVEAYAVMGGNAGIRPRPFTDGVFIFMMT